MKPKASLSQSLDMVIKRHIEYIPTQCTWHCEDPEELISDIKQCMHNYMSMWQIEADHKLYALTESCENAQEHIKRLDKELKELKELVQPTLS